MPRRGDGGPANDVVSQNRDWKPAFLEAFRKTGMATHAADVAGISRRRVYQVRASDPEFAAAWDDVVERTTEVMEREAYRRAVVGTEKPVFQGGRQVGTIREHSDVLLMFLIKKRNPEYRENYTVRHEGGRTDRLDVNVRLDAGQREGLAEILRSRPVVVDSTAVDMPVPELEAGDGE